jgi:hypothetical protein
MKFYRLSKSSVVENHCGYEFFTSEHEANKARREWYGNFEIEEQVTDRGGSEWEIIEVKPTKAGILKALNRFASHPDNG